MAERIKIKFLTVIWGARYIEEFARISLPSYLAPGNLPALAREADLEVVVMTSRDSRELFDHEPTMARLSALCSVSFINIDDLITTGNYGVTLTLAYARGIMASGPEQTNTCFIFMNSDFVLSDGSLNNLVARLQGGSRCVMAPSLRVRSEEIVPLLTEKVRDHVLSMSSRDLVRIALTNLHPTVVAKTATQNFVTCATHNQIYWQVDENTLLGRYHLIFMLAIKPEVPLTSVNSYCDYGFVPELVPSGEFEILNDSDEFMMVEVQSSAQEKHLLNCGTASASDIARELSGWTTREHRRFAEVDVVFHSADLPNRLQQVRAEAERLVADVHKQMSAKPMPHADHFYWSMGLQSWAALKYSGVAGPRGLPPEVGRESDEATSDVPLGTEQNPLALKHLYLKLLGRVRDLAGIIPNVPIWHHLWLDSRLLLRWIAAQTRPPYTRHAFICEENSPLAVSVPKIAPFELSIGLAEFLARREQSAAEGAARDGFDSILIQVTRANVRRVRPIIEAASSHLKPSGTIGLYVRHENAEMDPSNFTAELSNYLEEILPADWLKWTVQATFVGGVMKRRLRRAERFLFRFLMPTSMLRLPLLFLAVALWPVVAALTALNNYRLRGLTAQDSFCTTALLSMTQAGTAAVPTSIQSELGAKSARSAARHSENRQPLTTVD